MEDGCTVVSGKQLKKYVEKIQKFNINIAWRLTGDFLFGIDWIVLSV